jgi:hypothetical protein
VQLIKRGVSELVLHTAARRAFRGMTVPQLKRLISMEKVPFKGKRPQREAEVTELLVRYCCPEMTDLQVMEIVQPRCHPCGGASSERKCLDAG